MVADTSRDFISPCHRRGRMVNRATDPLIRPASTEVAGHDVVDVGAGGLADCSQEDGGSHHLSRLTVAALRDLLGESRLLHGMTSTSYAQTPCARGEHQACGASR